MPYRSGNEMLSPEKAPLIMGMDCRNFKADIKINIITGSFMI